MNGKIKKSVSEIIIVEGRYDKNTVLQAVNATVMETSGFGILKNKEKTELIIKLAEKQGVIILTDNDKAGFFIRGRLKSMLGTLVSNKIKHAYIPDIEGKEKRKGKSSKEGKIGVEGMSESIIIEALKNAGVAFSDADPDFDFIASIKISKPDLYEYGLCGKPDSAEKRKILLKQLKLPERLSTNALLDVLNILFTRDEFIENTIYKI